MSQAKTTPVARLKFGGYELPITRAESAGLGEHAEHWKEATGTYWGLLAARGLVKTAPAAVPNFTAAFPLHALKPAAYNPRRIDGEAFAALCASLRKLGTIKPLIIDQAGTLLAGHQRLRALRANGCATAPVFCLPKLRQADEVRFNLLHNAVDLELGDGRLHLSRRLAPGWHVVSPRDLRCERRPTHAALMVEVHRLIETCGHWGAAIASEDGEIILHALYAYCCHVARRPLLVRVIPRRLAAGARRSFARAYGEYDYSAHAGRATWNQTWAQMNRLRSPARGKSRLYENMVLPELARCPRARVLDFGAGQLDYVKRLRKEGRDILGLEFFLRHARSGHLNETQVHADITRLCHELATRGRFDIVVCDSVLNSVDSLQAEADVLLCLHALCKPGGTVFFSGRPSEHNAEGVRARVSGARYGHKRRVQFTDRHGFSGNFRHGEWFFQKFHSHAQAVALGARYFGPCAYERHRASWRARAVNVRHHSAPAVAAALEREFDLPLPGGRTFGRSADILRAWRAALAMDTPALAAA